jgi:signal transduction histidine kinase
MRINQRGNLVYLVVILIGSLLIADILLTYHNNKIIQKNKRLQQETQQIKIYYDQIGKLIIQALDLGLRGYAIVQTDKLVQPMHNAVAWKDSILQNVEEPLIKQGYDMSEFSVLKDSLTSYTEYCFMLKSLLDSGQDEEFKKLFMKDKGAHMWYQYVLCEQNIIKFENKINQEAETSYREALNKNHLLQIVIFLISIPTLFFTAFYTVKTFNLSELLRNAEIDKNKFLKEQNEKLEEMVTERTEKILGQNKEILIQSEELAAQRDALAVQNKQLSDAQKIIEEQNKEIQYKNTELEREVENRTQELQYANQQLIEHNNQLEQFSFITAHNLRAPLARILGLANVLEITNNIEERERLLLMLVSSTRDLDQVIKDLNVILEIKKQTGNLSKVNLENVFARVTKILEKECEETNATIIHDFNEVQEIEAVAPYVESILYNLISNALKYRHPNRSPVIKITTSKLKDFVCLKVEDNGLGIDLGKHKQNLFNLYRRFHFHMEGKGLGLHLVKTQIMAIGGKIDVESELDKGTTFIVYFKL